MRWNNKLEKGKGQVCLGDNAVAGQPFSWKLVG